MQAACKWLKFNDELSESRSRLFTVIICPAGVSITILETKKRNKTKHPAYSSLPLLSGDKRVYEVTIPPQICSSFCQQEAVQVEHSVLLPEQSDDMKTLPWFSWLKLDHETFTMDHPIYFIYFIYDHLSADVWWEI